MERTKIDYDEYDLLDEFTVGHIAVGYTLKGDGTCDGHKAGLIKDALGQAILKGELSSSLQEDNDLYNEYLSPDGPKQQIDWRSKWGSSIKIQRDDLIKWFESKGQQPAFLFKEARLSGEQQDIEALISSAAQQKNASPLSSPGDLCIVVDDTNERVIVVAAKGVKEQRLYSRGDIMRSGTVVWDLLVDFARCEGLLEGNTQSDVKKRNTSANRKNLGGHLMKALCLDKSPIVNGRKGVMRFASIVLASNKRSVDALDRNTVSLDDPASVWLKSHGDDIPPD